uniref:Uncharacterized protein n=1 Tax=Shewanella decolorationis TaxID=256839 RepID=A0A5B8R0N6_9GAMM
MSSGVPQANKFYEEVAETKVVWFGVSPGEILLEFDLKDKKVSFPVWSRLFIILCQIALYF